MVWYGMVWCGMVWYGMVWYGMVQYTQILTSRNGPCNLHISATWQIRGVSNLGNWKGSMPANRRQSKHTTDAVQAAAQCCFVKVLQNTVCHSCITTTPPAVSKHPNGLTQNGLTTEHTGSLKLNCDSRTSIMLRAYPYETPCLYHNQRAESLPM